MKETSQSSTGDARSGFQGKHRLPPISLPLHEALGLCLLFQASEPETIQELQTDDGAYGLSAAYGYLRLREAIAELFSDTESVRAISAERAALDQVQEAWSD